MNVPGPVPQGTGLFFIGNFSEIPYGKKRPADFVLSQKFSPQFPEQWKTENDPKDPRIKYSNITVVLMN